MKLPHRVGPERAVRQELTRRRTHQCKPARSWLPGGLAILLMLAVDCASAAITAEEATQLLARADNVKTADHAEFARLLRSLEQEAQTLSPSQRQFLRYLQAWRNVYDGEYELAIPRLKSVVDEAKDRTLRFRGGVTLVNVLALATQYEEAFARLTKLLEVLPLIADNNAREQALGVAALLYNQVGQYDLGLSYAEKLIQENWADRGACKGGQLKLEALYKSGRLQTVSPEFQAGVDACNRLGELLRSNAIRTYMVRLHITARRFDEAIRFLSEHYDEVQTIHSPRLSSEYDTLLAQAYWQKGDVARAREFATSAIRSGVKNEYTEPLVTAYYLLYVIARAQGDDSSALTYHEKYAAADKGYLDDVSARQLAYEKVNHAGIASKLQIDALNKQNEVLQLQQALNKKASEASRLYITLLLMLIAFILLWAYRTKRSQLHFMKLSRIDGLTGVANRPYFIDQAERALDTSRKLRQETCIVLCDLDHFKQINDKYGHATGDFVLKQAVIASRARLRESDILGRFGGEEFGIVLPGCSLADARQRCEQLRLAITEIATHPSSMVANVSASFGIASTGSSGYELRQLLAHADAALYRAKRGGRNIVMTHDPKDAADDISGRDAVAARTSLQSSR